LGRLLSEVERSSGLTNSIVYLDGFVKRKIARKIVDCVSLQLLLEILVYRIGVGSPEKLAAAHLNYDRTPDTPKQAGLNAIANHPPSGDPLRKIPEGSLPQSDHPL
jgi:hypothetical protein